MNRHQFNAGHAFTRAHKASTRAIRHGDLTAADKWLKIAERHERLALRLYKLNDAQIDFEMLEKHARIERRRLRDLRRAP